MVAKKKGSRRAATRTPPAISRMYARWTLDCVVEAATAIASDFVSRPRQYTRVSEETAERLENLWYRNGTDPHFPDMAKRLMVFAPPLGPSDGKIGQHASQFHSDSSSLMERARAFTERQVQTGEENLRRAFLDEMATFRSYLSTLVDNAVIVNGDRQTGSMFELCVFILLDEVVAGVFGRPPADSDGWPLSSNSLEDKGARLIEEVTGTLQVGDGIVSQSQFIVMQRIALYGAQTIAGVLEADLAPQDLSDNDPLIQLAYSWKTALDALRS